MSHTPGPWKVDRPYIRGAGRVIASLESGRNEVEDAANARLIAAAPELLEVCEALLALNNTLVVELSESDWLKYKREAERKAKAALAKAHGIEVEGE